MDGDRLSRILWVASLLLTLAGIVFVLVRYGAEWGIGAAP